MSFRSDFQDFPFYSKDKKGVWYFIIDWKNKTKIQFCTVEKRDLILKLSELEKAKLDVDFQLFGVGVGSIQLIFLNYR